MLKTITFATLLALSAGAAMAADPVAGVYAGADVGTTKVDDFGDRETSYGAFVGYQFNPNVAVELGYRRLASYDFPSGSVNVNQTSLSVLPMAPLGNGFTVYGRLGYGHNSANASGGGRSASASDSSGIVGLGVSYQFTPKVFGRAEIQRAAEDTNNFSIGIGFKF